MSKTTMMTRPPPRGEEYTKITPDTPERFKIAEGAEYIFCATEPVQCRGHRYRVECFLPYLPSRKELVLVRALSGPEEGLLFACTPHRFAIAYAPVHDSSPEIDLDALAKKVVAISESKPLPLTPSVDKGKAGQYSVYDWAKNDYVLAG